MSVVIGNLCYDKVYKHKRSLVRVDIKDEAIHSGQEDILTGIILENEFDRLKKILILYNKQQKKIEFILKVYFRCPVSRKDFLELSDKLSDEDFERFDNNIDIKKLHTDKIIFEFITPILNKIDNKNNASDAVRKWVRLKIDEIIELINGTPARTNYTKETLQILMEKFFAKNC